MVPVCQGSLPRCVMGRGLQEGLSGDVHSAFLPVATLVTVLQ